METIISNSKNPLLLNNKLVEQLLVRFLKDEIRNSGFSRAVIGLSGGIDSAVVAFLLVKALGKKNVKAILMPYKTSSKNSITDSNKILGKLDIEFEKIEITSFVDKLFLRNKITDKIRKGNIMARSRMIILYDQSQKNKALVIGTSNKTEIMLGYGTLFGDLASAINPIGDLYKTQIRSLAEFIGVPKTIIEKAPSADLWHGQTDESDFGFSYEEVDKLLYYLIDERNSITQLIKKGFNKKMIERVIYLIKKNQFKRRLPVICKISNRTVNIDFRYPRDWGI